MSGVDADADEDDDNDNEPIAMTDDNGVNDSHVQRNEHQDPRQRAHGQRKSPVRANIKKLDSKSNP